MLAPLIVFAYNRPDHLKETLKALSKNEEAHMSDLFVFIDGPKSEKGIEKNKEVEEVARSFKEGFFKKVDIINSEKNKGLANSVIAGVTRIINEYGKAIVTEDDSVCSSNYLGFMNKALDYYRNDDSAWSVGGFTVPMDIPVDYHYDIIKTQRVSSCAWATWKDRWEKIAWDMPDYKRFRFDFKKRKEFNKWGDDRASMLDDQMNSRINSWAIRFDYYMYKNRMYNIIPRYSLVKNIGFDGSGTHNGKIENNISTANIHKGSDFLFDHIDIDEKLRSEFTKNFKVSKFNKLKRFLGNLFYKKRK